MTQLKNHQLVALMEGKKTGLQGTLTAMLRTLQHEANFQGSSKIYKPKDEASEQKPPENKLVKFRANIVAKTAAGELGDIINLQFALDATNCEARADVTVDGEPILKNCPVTFLIWLDKRLQDWNSIVEALPTLSPDTPWTWNATHNMWESPITVTGSREGKRVNHIKAAATEQHPAQVEIVTDQVLMGYLHKRDYSSAVPPSIKEKLVERVSKLRDAVKVARGRANEIEAEVGRQGDELMKFLLDVGDDHTAQNQQPELTTAAV